jgi:hypothetical protein
LQKSLLLREVATHCLPETTSWRKLLKDCIFFSSLLGKKNENLSKEMSLGTLG